MPKQPSPVILTGNDLRICDLVDVARRCRGVNLERRALIRAELSHRTLLAAADRGVPIYGVNRGVGPYADVALERYTPNTPSGIEAFNLDLLFSHCAGIGLACPVESVRAAMLVRANTLLLGTAGCSPSIIKLLMEFLNHRIHPLVPMYSSVGETDINLLAHIGAAMIGQGEVQFRGAKISANAALKKARLKPIRLGGKDALSISSSNAFSVGSVALTLNEASSLLILADQIFALHLEAFEAAASILMQPGTKRAHEDIHYRKCIDRLCKYLHGSFLWKSSSLRLQEPLSFRITTSIHSAAHRIVSHLTKELELKLNSSSDNPAVFTDKQSTKSNLKSATIIQTGNFELSEVTILVESLCAAIARVASVCCERMARLAELGGRTGQFFANDQMPFGLIGLNRVCVCLNAELQQAAIPSSGLATFVNQTEDLVSNAPLAIMRLSRISDRFAAILAVALFQAAHAIEMRSVSRPGDRLGAGTGKLFHRFRLEVPVLQRHFPLTPSLESSLAFIRKLVLSEVSEVQDGC